MLGYYLLLVVVGWGSLTRNLTSQLLSLYCALRHLGILHAISWFVSVFIQSPAYFVILTA